MMGYKTILYEKDGPNRIITLNRPEAANALNEELSKEFYEVISECSTDNSVRSVVLTGKGKMFCGGGDLKFLLSKKNEVKKILLNMTNYLHGAIARMAKMNAPVVVAVNGTAGGGGLSLAISGDIVISSESAKYTLAYTKAGLSPDASSTFYLPRLIGMRRARELMLTNRMLSAKEAYEIGMIDKVVSDDRLMEVAIKQAQDFASGATQADHGDLAVYVVGGYGASTNTTGIIVGGSGTVSYVTHKQEFAYASNTTATQLTALTSTAGGGGHGQVPPTF